MKDPAFLFYSSDFLTGTMLMTNEQIGKYIRLICLQHQSGHLSEKHMLNICGAYDEDIFSKFAKDEQGLFFNARCEVEITKRKKYCESRKSNKINSLAKKDTLSYDKTYVKHSEDENENINEVKIINNNEIQVCEILIYPTFEDFWTEYDKKVDRPKSENMWKKLTQKERELIMQYIPHYKQSQPEKQYRKNPTTFFNNKSWENEIINLNQQKNGNANGNVRISRENEVKRALGIANNLLGFGEDSQT